MLSTMVKRSVTESLCGDIDLNSISAYSNFQGRSKYRVLSERSVNYSVMIQCFSAPVFEGPNCIFTKIVDEN